MAADVNIPPDKFNREDVWAGLAERDRQLHSLKELVGRMAHDFNNFLVPFLGYVSLVRDELATGSAALPYLSTMEQSARRTEQVLETLLMAVRPQRRFNPQKIDLGEIARSAVEDLEKQEGLPENFEVHTELSSCPWVGDHAQWSLVFQNLLANARYALSMGGRLQVTVKKERLEKDVQETVGFEDPAVYMISVEDNGIGMRAEVRERAMEPFFSTRARGQSMGMGLTIAHSVTLYHGGQILLESDEDAGTRVTLVVPQQALQTVSPSEADAVEATGWLGARTTARAGTSKVLLVDDDPMVREVVKSYLQRLQMEVVTAKDGADGLRLFKRYAKDLALVVSDVMMPKLDGIDLFLEVRKLERGVPFLLMTGNKAIRQNEYLQRLGEDRPPLLEKPFTVRQFLDQVRQHLPEQVAPETA